MLYPLLCIVGPTAVGKTTISVETALKIRGEIISGDSMQVYRYMDIGTAKPSLKERRGVPHHLVDILLPHEPFSVADFQSEAFKLIPQIFSRNRLPILAGGTGLYLKAIVDQYNFGEISANWELREKLREQANSLGNQHLYRKLRIVDPKSAEKIHPNDLKRIIRALEVFLTTGRPISSFNELAPEKRFPLKPLIIGLTMNRSRLYNRINLRVEQMMAGGLEQEVRDLLKRGYSPQLVSMQGLGYRHMINFLKERYTKEEAVELLKRDTRRFAKRQLTLFKRNDKIVWIDLDKYLEQDEIVEKICYFGRNI
ncbi:tRNA (adenosine(37)-N6)-dimethylallyltransferase MiaA [Candidatus Contubernalis alkaliaceticus]|uniref:tRNA (adenosine(37)-N6)-dimethylallyltransferase MiaA n=1 Tax=Candidatus Contubernalis alkaliaceticus TaxID=338645 RepID=UPI001F4BE084|nr:tRNA (adenosine(37)-N6)-dimethylallyltransferase MiaA [Candidatus Contubernalis alkalaceticus]